MSGVFYLPALFGAHATCSVSMTLLNKTIAQGFDFPWTVLFIQNIGTVAIGYIYSCFRKQEVKAANVEEGETPKVVHRKLFGMKVPVGFKSRMWVLLQVFFFMATLFTSLKALKFISVPLYVVARNTVPAQTALLERIFNNVRLSLVAILGLFFTVVGAIVYTYGDLNSGLSFTGLVYAVVLTLVVAGCSVVDKTAVRYLGEVEDISPAECNQLRVAVSLPFNVLFMILLEFQSAAMLVADASDEAITDINTDPPKLDIYQSSANISFAVGMSILLSTVFGYGMGTFNFYLQQAVNAATVQVANILYKLATTMVSRVTHPTAVSASSWAGFALSLLGIALYTFGPKMWPVQTSENKS